MPSPSSLLNHQMLSAAAAATVAAISLNQHQSNGGSQSTSMLPPQQWLNSHFQESSSPTNQQSTSGTTSSSKLETSSLSSSTHSSGTVSPHNLLNSNGTGNHHQQQQQNSNPSLDPLNVLKSLHPDQIHFAITSALAAIAGNELQQQNLQKPNLPHLNGLHSPSEFSRPRGQTMSQPPPSNNHHTPSSTPSYFRMNTELNAFMKRVQEEEAEIKKHDCPKAELAEPELWKAFHKMTTEMVITKSGR